MKTQRVLPGLLLCVAIGVAGCGSGDGISGSYQGTETTQLLAGGTTERGAARTRVSVEATDEVLQVTAAECQLTLQIALEGVAELRSDAACAVETESEGTVMFSLELGEAVYGDGDFGLTLLGTTDDDARWEYTFAGRREAD